MGIHLPILPFAHSSIHPCTWALDPLVLLPDMVLLASTPKPKPTQAMANPSATEGQCIVVAWLAPPRCYPLSLADEGLHLEPSCATPKSRRRKAGLWFDPSLSPPAATSAYLIGERFDEARLAAFCASAAAAAVLYAVYFCDEPRTLSAGYFIAFRFILRKIAAGRSISHYYAIRTK